jgi:hypothetical protein
VAGIGRLTAKGRKGRPGLCGGGLRRARLFARAGRVRSHSMPRRAGQAWAAPTVKQPPSPEPRERAERACSRRARIEFRAPQDSRRSAVRARCRRRRSVLRAKGGAVHSPDRPGVRQAAAGRAACLRKQPCEDGPAVTDRAGNASLRVCGAIGLPGAAAAPVAGCGQPSAEMAGRPTSGAAWGSRGKPSVGRHARAVGVIMAAQQGAMWQPQGPRPAPEPQRTVAESNGSGPRARKHPTAPPC